MLVAVLVGLMISLVVGIALVPVIIDAAKDATENTNNGALEAVVSVLPFVFVAIILLGAVAWITSVGEEGGKREEKHREPEHHYEDEIPRIPPQIREEAKPGPTEVKKKEPEADEWEWGRGERPSKWDISAWR